MHGLLLAAVLALSAPRTDTTFSVPAGAKLSLENFAGQIEVNTWAKSAVRIQADHSRRTSIEIERDGSEVTISSENQKGPPGTVDYILTVPASMGLSLSGVYCDIKTDGLKGTLEVETVQGDVEIRGGSGRVSAQSVQGRVVLSNVSGQIDASSVNEGVTVTGARGDLTAESVNGAVRISGSQLHTLEASTVNGAVAYDGVYDKDGHYELSTHSGSVYASIPENANLNVQVESYDGSFESSFPVKHTSEGRNRRRFNLTFGTGDAELTLETFQGSIRLYRPGEKIDLSDDSDDDSAPAQSKEKSKEKSKSKAPHSSDPDKDSNDGDDDGQ